MYTCSSCTHEECVTAWIIDMEWYNMLKGDITATQNQSILPNLDIKTSQAQEFCN